MLTPRPSASTRAANRAAAGKGDAVRRGFAAAKGEVIMILDADLSVMPEDLPKFFLTVLANKMFGMLFSWLLEQQVRDTLCGTKALLRRDYERIAKNRAVFGNFDPFGDFDLLFGAANLG